MPKFFVVEKVVYEVEAENEEDAMEAIITSENHDKLFHHVSDRYVVEYDEELPEGGAYQC